MNSWTDGATLEAIATQKMSTDRGAHWTTVTNTPWARGGGPVAFNDGTAVMLGLTAYSSSRRPRLKVATSPDRGKTWQSFEPR